MKKTTKLAFTAASVLALMTASLPVYAEGPGEPPEGESGGPGGGTPPDMPDGGMGGGGANTQTFDYSGTYSGTLSADGSETTSENEEIESAETDVNAILAQNGGTVSVSGAKVSKSGDDSDGDRCNFYGVNSIVLAVGEGSRVNISDSQLTADSEGSNAIFATDSGTVYANKVTIHTTADNSRGLDATYDGTIIAYQADITTEGDHCAAAATDRGGGTVSVSDSTLSTAGSGSPLLYSTGYIEAGNTTGTATGSQIAGMEGLNTIIIANSDLTSTITGKTASDPIADAVIIYQSTSGDADTSTGSSALFQATDSTLTSAIEEGAFFYITNTTARVILQNTELNYDSAKAGLMYIAGNDANNWGSAGSNGASVVFSAYAETLNGDITVDTISSLDAYFLEGTVYTGAMTVETNSSGSASDAPITVNIDSTSKWVVTGNSEISALNAEAGSQIVDESGNAVTVIADGETVIEGTSEYTVTVTGSYSDTVTLSDDNTVVTEYTDRTEFDAYFGTDSAFKQTETKEETAETAETEETVETEETAAEETAESSSVNPMIFIAGGAAILAALILVLMKRKK